MPEPVPVPEPEPEPTPEPMPTPAAQPVPQPQATPEPEPQPATARQRAVVSHVGSTGGLMDAPPSYRSRLQAWLARYKEYPRRARRLNIQGVATLVFTIDRSGHVLEWEITDSSGARMLDDAVANMIRRADPLPPMPEQMTIARMKIAVPVSFQLH